MSILDKIRGGPRRDKGSSAKKQQIQKEANVLDMVKEAPAGEKETAAKARVLKENTAAAYRILKSAHLSEKTNSFSNFGRYVFRVDGKANKIEVKKAVEAAYDVHVLNVNMINIKGKTRRTGRKTGQTQDWKKAIVTLKSGEKIAGLTEGV